jgi:hypothetical protein
MTSSTIRCDDLQSPLISLAERLLKGAIQRSETYGRDCYKSPTRKWHDDRVPTAVLTGAQHDFWSALMGFSSSKADSSSQRWG